MPGQASRVSLHGVDSELCSPRCPMCSCLSTYVWLCLRLSSQIKGKSQDDAKKAYVTLVEGLVAAQ